VAFGLGPQTCGACRRTRGTIGAETCPTMGEGRPSHVAADALDRSDFSSSGAVKPARAGLDVTGTQIMGERVGKLVDPISLTS
jgi:hypothetical protein